MTPTGLLIVSNLKQLRQTLQQMNNYVRKLFIHLNIPAAVIQAKPPPIWGKLISELYIDTSKHSSDIAMDVRVLVGPLKGKTICGLRPIDILFSDSRCPEFCEPLREALNIQAATVYLSQQQNEADILENLKENDGGNAKALKAYETVVLGGTFDRIHVGHKIFLTQAVLRACRRLVVGVTTSQMTRSKTLWELILPVEQRIQGVREFLKEIDDSVQYEVVPIDDAFGPTRTDPNMDMIMVSEETLRGGHKVNEIRLANNLKPLEIFCVGMVESCDKSGPKEHKVSSSNTRIDLLGTRLRMPEPRPNLAMDPYIIGLTGGIASGKSQMSQRFHNMGAVIMDCDKIAHEIYAPGQSCFDKIVAHFGPSILDEGNRSIDRKKLGTIVFGKSQELAALDAIVWPELMLEVRRRIAAARAGGGQRSIVIIEAAVLLQAGWQNECHEVWSMIVPPELAVQRVMERNKLNEDEARRRMASQMSNSEIVAKSHVVFSSQWGADFTQIQAERAWRMLQQEINEREQTKSNTNSSSKSTTTTSSSL